MNENVLKNLNKLRKKDFIKLEYFCDDCGNIVYRTLYKAEIISLIENSNDFEPIPCSICEEEKMMVKNIVNEKDF